LSDVRAVLPAPDGGYPGGNTAEGQHALLSLTTGGFNTAIGFSSLNANTTGSFSTGVGAGALDLNNGNENTATGTAALLLNTTGVNNTANGAFALILNNAGSNNTAVGDRALENNTASQNTAVGSEALVANTSGAGNTAIGDVTLIGQTTGSFNIGLGFGAGNNVVTASNVICIGASGQDVSNTTWINNIYGTTTVSGTTLPVVVSDGGQLGTASSSRRFKKEIKPMDSTSEAILALKPVTFHYKSDNTGTPQFGLVAEEVAEVNPNLVVRDKNGEIYTVRYDAVNAMLLNEFLKAHRKMEEQEAKIAHQQKQIEALTAGLQQVSAQLEMSKPAGQTVLNNQ
jgi:hypothetical protein